jgi:SOS response regulatory protein OraA/RecX
MVPPPSLIAHAVRLLAVRPHSVGELTFKLSRVCMRRKSAKRAATLEEYKDVSCATSVADIVDLLKAHGALDDTSYAQWHVENRVNFRPRSRAHLVAELRAKYVPSELISEALSEDTGQYREADACLEAANRKARLPTDSLIKYLVRKGFSYQLIKQTLKVQQENNSKELSPTPLS